MFGLFVFCVLKRERVEGVVAVLVCGMGPVHGVEVVQDAAVTVPVSSLGLLDPFSSKLPCRACAEHPTIVAIVRCLIAFVITVVITTIGICFLPIADATVVIPLIP